VWYRQNIEQNLNHINQINVEKNHEKLSRRGISVLWAYTDYDLSSVASCREMYPSVYRGFSSYGDFVSKELQLVAYVYSDFPNSLYYVC
jgi:hypothetical protein